MDIFISMLRKKGASFCALYHRNKEASEADFPKQKKAKVGECPEEDETREMLFTETGSTVDSAVENVCDIVREPGLLGDDMMKYARKSCISVNADDTLDM